MQGTRVPFLVGELRSHMPGAAKAVRCGHWNHGPQCERLWSKVKDPTWRREGPRCCSSDLMETREEENIQKEAPGLLDQDPPWGPHPHLTRSSSQAPVTWGRVRGHDRLSAHRLLVRLHLSLYDGCKVTSPYFFFLIFFSFPYFFSWREMSYVLCSELRMSLIHENVMLSSHVDFCCSQLFS